MCYGTMVYLRVLETQTVCLDGSLGDDGNLIVTVVLKRLQNFNSRTL